MTRAEWVGVLLLAWCVLSIPVGLLVGKFIARGRPSHRMTPTTRARSRIQIRRKKR